MVPFVKYLLTAKSSQQPFYFHFLNKMRLMVCEYRNVHTQRNLLNLPCIVAVPFPVVPVVAGAVVVVQSTISGIVATTSISFMLTSTPAKLVRTPRRYVILACTATLTVTILDSSEEMVAICDGFRLIQEYLVNKFVTRVMVDSASPISSGNKL